MKLESMKSYPFEVASLVAGGEMCNFLEFIFSVLDSLPINLYPEYSGITAFDHLFPLKPKNPI